MHLLGFSFEAIQKLDKNVSVFHNNCTSVRPFCEKFPSPHVHCATAQTAWSWNGGDRTSSTSRVVQLICNDKHRYCGRKLSLS